VVWVITVEVFLVTLAAGVSILYFFYRRNQNRDTLTRPQEKRTEGRTRFRVDVELISTDEPFQKEVTVPAEQQVGQRPSRELNSMRDCHATLSVSI
jgi:hypothetical protein